MRIIVALTVAMVALVTPAQAWIHGAVTGPTGTTQQQIGELYPAIVKNVLKMGALNFSGGVTPGTAGIDANGYPTSSFTGSLSVSFGSNFFIGSTQAPGGYTFIWKAGTKLAIQNLGSNSGCALSGVGGAVSGCASNNVTLTIDGTGAGSMTFTPSTLSLFYVAGASYGAAGTADLALMRVVDAPDYSTYIATNDARKWFTQAYLDQMAGLHLKTIRPMGWTDQGSSNLNNEVKWSCRATPNSSSWHAFQWCPSAWGGDVSGTDAYTMASLPSGMSSGAWVANEVLQGNFLNAATKITIGNAVSNGGLCRLTVNSSTTLTTGQSVWTSTISGVTGCTGIFTITVINPTTIDLQSSTFAGTFAVRFPSAVVSAQTITVPGKTGAKFLADTIGQPIFSAFGDAFPAGPSTGFYDAILDAVIFTPNGFVSSVPIEVQASLANYLNANLVGTIPAYVEDSYVTSWATAALGALGPSQYFMPAYSNEVWNFGFPQTGWAFSRGVALGLTSQPVLSWYALRTRQIMGNLIPPVWSGRMSQLRRVLDFQAAGDSATLNYRMKGQALAPSGVSTGTGNALYSSFTGGADYTAFPNRTADVVEVFQYAPYAGGANLFYGPDIKGNTGAATAVNQPFWQALVNAWESGATATAIALVDDDVRQGRTAVQTVNCNGTTLTTPAAHGLISGFFVAFQVTGGTSCSGLTIPGAIYQVSGTSSVGCPGAVICNFTMQAFIAGFATGGSVNSGTPGTGTVTVGHVGGNNNFQTLQALNSNWYAFGESLAAAFDGSRPPGMALVRNEQYEGGITPVGPPAADCVSVGVTTPNPITISFTATSHANTGLTGLSSVSGLINGMVISGGDMAASAVITNIDPFQLTATVTPAATGSNAGESLTATGNCGTDIASAITAWKTDPMSAATVQAYYNQFLGRDSTMPTFGNMLHSKTPSQLGFLAPLTTDANNPASNPYSLVSQSIPGSSVFQLYNGSATFSGVQN